MPKNNVKKLFVLLTTLFLTGCEVNQQANTPTVINIDTGSGNTPTPGGNDNPGEDPTEPVDPVDPVDPTPDPDPTQGGDTPTDPVDPVEPVDPIDPVDPVNPVDPVDPTPDPEPTPIDSNHGLSQDDPLTPAEAIALMNEAGEGKIAGDGKLFYVQGTFSNDTKPTKYHGWTGSIKGSELRIVDAINKTDYKVEEVDGEMNGFNVVISGYLELYKGAYQIGYLPASISPTGNKFNPSIVKINIEGEEETHEEPTPVTPVEEEEEEVVTPVVESGWTLVKDASELNDGDQIALGISAKGVLAGNMSGSYLSSSNATFGEETISNIDDDALVLTLGKVDSYFTLTNTNNELLGATAVKKLAWGEGSTKWSISISGDQASITNENESYGTILYNVNSPRFTSYTSTPSSSMILPEIYKGGSAEPVYPTALSISGSNEVSVNKTTQLSVKFTPSNTNQKEVSWSSSDETVASVSKSGLVSAKKVGSTTITAKAKDVNNNYISNTFNISVVEASSSKSKYTIMVYLCGADLESDSSAKLATSNINEMLSVNKPDDVNIILETGGCKKWYTSGISSSVVQRHHIENKKVVLDKSLTNVSMGESSTLQSFIEWGLSEYPADKTGVILWNHGGAMDGVCFDEKHDNDSLTSDEVDTALKNAFKNSNREEKLEWIGYDACLMSVQDVAEINSHYFNYMVASQESEPGEGWDYDVWLKQLANNPSINSTELLPTICDSFVSKCASSYNSYSNSKGYNDSTLSVLDLSKMSDYATSWEKMAKDLATVINTSKKWNTFTTNILNKGQRFGYYDSSYGYAYDIYDVDDFLENIINSSTYSVAKTNAQKTLEYFEELVIHNTFGPDAFTGSYNKNGKNDASGLCFFAPTSGINSASTCYTSSMTNFTNWRNMCVSYGNWN